MKIEVNKIPPEGLILEEDFSAVLLGLETEIIKFPGPIKIAARVSRITNTVSVLLVLTGLMRMQCVRCLSDFQADFEKELKLHYPVDKFQPVIELNEDIREEIILDYPLNPLCKPDCEGLCPKCGRSLNQGTCDCAAD